MMAVCQSKDALFSVTFLVTPDGPHRRNVFSSKILIARIHSISKLKSHSHNIHFLRNLKFKIYFVCFAYPLSEAFTTLENMKYYWQRKLKYSETCPSANLSTINPTCICLGSNLWLHGEEPLTNRLFCRLQNSSPWILNLPCFINSRIVSSNVKQV